MSQRIFFAAFLATALGLSAWGGEQRGQAWIYQQSGSGFRVSIETYQTRQGWTPVIVSVAGADVTAVMDARGRVVPARTKGASQIRPSPFVIELEKGRILLEGKAHAISVFEQNAVRTRFRMIEGAIELPLRFDALGKRGTLRFGGLEIPAQVSSAVPNMTNRSGRSAATGMTVLAKKERGAVAQLQPQRIKARVK